MHKKILSLFLWILTFQLMGYFTGVLTQQDIATWYQGLQKSALNPPNIVFPIVWTILYVMLAVAGWSLWQHRRQSQAKPALLFFTLQMVMNWTWTPIFFNLHWVGFAFVWLIGIIIFTVITLFYTGRKFKLATFLLIPYLCWLLFAAYLNGVIFYYQ